jgi:hypothetical protein
MSCDTVLDGNGAVVRSVIVCGFHSVSFWFLAVSDLVNRHQPISGTDFFLHQVARNEQQCAEMSVTPELLKGGEVTYPGGVEEASTSTVDVMVSQSRCNARLVLGNEASEASTGGAPPADVPRSSIVYERHIGSVSLTIQLNYSVPSEKLSVHHLRASMSPLA